jgi:hypothetical protein
LCDGSRIGPVDGEENIDYTICPNIHKMPHQLTKNRVMLMVLSNLEYMTREQVTSMFKNLQPKLDGADSVVWIKVTVSRDSQSMLCRSENMHTNYSEVRGDTKTVGVGG